MKRNKKKKKKKKKMRIHVLILSCLAWAVSCHPQELERLADEIMASNYFEIFCSRIANIPSLSLCSHGNVVVFTESDVNELAETLASSSTKEINDLLLSASDDDMDSEERMRFRASIHVNHGRFRCGSHHELFA